MTLGDYRKYLSLSFDQFVAAYNISDGEVTRNVAYEGIVPADRVDFQGGVFFGFFEGVNPKIPISWFSPAAGSRLLCMAKLWILLKSIRRNLLRVTSSIFTASAARL
jgi:hypothetical protein